MRNPFHLTKFIFAIAIALVIPVFSFEPVVENVAENGPSGVQQEDDLPLIFNEAGAQRFRAKKSGKIVRVEELNVNEVAAPRRVGRRALADMPPLPQDAQVVLERNRAQREMLRAQFLQNARPNLQAELMLVRQLCPDLTVEQRIKIRGAMDAHVDAAADQFVDERNRSVRQNAKSVGALPANLREALVATLAENHSAEIAGRYRDESLQQLARRKKAAIMQAVAEIDSILFLSEDQHRAISKKLVEVSKADNQVDLIHAGRFVSPELSNVIPVFLNGDQLTVWQTLQQEGVELMQVVVDAGAVDDNWWGPDRPEDQAPQAAMRAAPRVMRVLRRR